MEARPALLAAALAAALPCVLFAEEVPVPEEAGATLVQIRSAPDIPSLSFEDLHGFEGTHHLAPVLLPAESKYSVLRSPKEVQDALRIDPVLRGLSEALDKALREEFQTLPTGRGLLETLGRPLPPVLLAESKDVVGAYKSQIDAIALNWRDVRGQFPEAAGLDGDGLVRWLQDDPSRVARLVRHFAPILAHELTHARQDGLFGLSREDVPNGGRYLEMEEEAYFMEMKLFLDEAERDPGLLVSTAAIDGTLTRELFAFVWDLDAYLAAVRASYRPRSSGHPAVALRAAAAAERRRASKAEGSRREALRRGLIALEKARLHFDKRLEELADDDWPGLSVRGMLLFARRDVKLRPPLALALAYRAGQRSQEQDALDGGRTFEARRGELEGLFAEAALEDLRGLLKRPDGAGTRQVRRRYAELIGDLCTDLKLDCRTLVREILEKEM